MFNGSPNFILMQKLKSLKKGITIWNKEAFGKVEERKTRALEELLILEQATENRPLSQEERLQMFNLKLEKNICRELLTLIEGTTVLTS